MAFKFIVLALVISASQGDPVEEHSLKVIPSGILSNKSQPLDRTTYLYTNVPPLEKAIPGSASNDSNDENQNSKAFSPDESQKTAANFQLYEKTTNTPLNSSNIISIIAGTETTSNFTPNATTTTTVQPTATPGPNPVPDPGEGKWIVRNKTEAVCIVAQMALEFNVTYQGSNNKVMNKTIFVPKNATSSGNCSKSTQSLQLRWGEGHSFSIVFGLNETLNKFEIQLFNLTINITDFGDGEVGSMQYLSNKGEFPAVPVKMSYKCDKMQMQMLNSTINAYYAKMFISHTQLEAFMNSKNATFNEAKDCEAFETPDIVPIAVGCVLCILVVVVFIAYIIGRKRSQSRGYLSM